MNGRQKFCKLLDRFGFIVGLATVLAFVTLAAGPVVAQGQAATFRVTKTADTADGSCDSDCSLREATIAGNASPDEDTVSVPPGRYLLTIGENCDFLGYSCDDGFDYEPNDPYGAAVGDLDIYTPMDIRGSGAQATIIDGGDRRPRPRRYNRLVDVGGTPGGWPPPPSPSKAVNLFGVTLTGGHPLWDDGGAIRTDADVTMTLSESIVRGNSVHGDPQEGPFGEGAGIFNKGTMRVERSSISRNISDNGGAAGISNRGTIRVERSTVHRNQGQGVGAVGAISNRGVVDLVNATVSHNRGGTVGGIADAGVDDAPEAPLTLTATNTTIAFNSGRWARFSSPGVRLEANSATPERRTKFLNTVVAHNYMLKPDGSRSARNCNRPLASYGANLENGTSCGFNRASDVNGDPRLGPLADNGGPTLTHSLLSGSPAIDAGGLIFPPTDQRGVVRPQDGDGNGSAVSDIGAFEKLRVSSPPVPSPTTCTRHGTPGNDVIRGTSGDDVICGGGGNDIVYSGRGNDTIRGGAGNDILRGEAGNDRLSGADGNDQVNGGDGDDRLNGGRGRDTLSGQDGRDYLDSRDGVGRNDVARGGAGADSCATDPRDVHSSC